jgi:transposase
MPVAVLVVRALAPEEAAQIERLARSRTAAARLVERAKMVQLARAGQHVPGIARALGVTEATVRLWLKRVNACGPDGLRDAPRSGRPPTYTADEVGTVVATALTAPEDLGLPFACWTLDRLAAYLHEARGIAIKRSRIDEILRAEGLRWRKQETWFGERVDPQFAEKRGPSSRSTRRHLRVVR